MLVFLIFIRVCYLCSIVISVLFFAFKKVCFFKIIASCIDLKISGSIIPLAVWNLVESEATL